MGGILSRLFFPLVNIGTDTQVSVSSSGSRLNGWMPTDTWYGPGTGPVHHTKQCGIPHGDPSGEKRQQQLRLCVVII